MRLLITGICGFVGSILAQRLLETQEGLTIIGLDNLSRAGSESNRGTLRQHGIDVRHGDLRQASDLDALPRTDWVIDAAANPSVLAGVDGKASSRQLIEHNLQGTINLLEYCQRHRAGFTLLSTSRVYSIPPLANLPVEIHEGAFRPAKHGEWPEGVTYDGISERFSTTPPVSLYGATKLASECLALEYGETFDFPVWINRCGVLAGAGQFGRADQGVFSFWIHSWAQRRPLKYIGFDGQGHQVRDCLHPRDLVPLLISQMAADDAVERPRVINVSGGSGSAMSLRQLSAWCAERFGNHSVESHAETRRFDLPWVVLDSRCAEKAWNWNPSTGRAQIMEEIARHTEAHPDWLDRTAA
jgi:CDP-paratose 2-epimerase